MKLSAGEGRTAGSVRIGYQHSLRKIVCRSPWEGHTASLAQTKPGTSKAVGQERRTLLFLQPVSHPLGSVPLLAGAGSQLLWG